MQPMDTLFYLGIILVLGACVERLAPWLHMPKVVGYLLLGLVIGPEVLGIIPQSFVENAQIVTDLALSIIAVLVGATLKFSFLRSSLSEIVKITLFQSLSTFAIVAAGFYLLGEHAGIGVTHMAVIALLLGGIATATDTAAPLSLVKELGANGRFTSTFLAVVALDDAVSLLMFIIALSIAGTLLGNHGWELASLWHVLFSVGASLLLGAFAGYLNRFFTKLFSHHRGMETIATLGIIFILFSVSGSFALEPLLCAMSMGAVLTNISKEFSIIEEEIDTHLAEIIFMLFFILSAMHLKLEALFALPVAIEIYVVLRVVGKVLGSYLGAVAAQSSATLKRYMGLALLPQAGVAIGLALSLQKTPHLEPIASIMLNIVIATTFIHELLGPIFTRYALVQSGECRKESKTP